MAMGVNDVWSSLDGGRTFSVATAAAAWTARADLAVAFFPGTNIVMIAGGANTGVGGTLNDSYVCQDGVGAVWTAASPLPTAAFSDAGMVALYDAASNPSGYSTVILAESSTSTIFASTTLGQSWQSVATQPWTSRYALTLTADADNFIYAAGGQNGDGNIYFSWNKAVSWAILSQAAYTAQWPQAVDYLYSHYSCQAIRYIPTTNTALPQLAHKQLIIYGGDGADGITASSITTVAAGTCTASSVTVVYGELLFPTTANCLQTGACAAQVVSSTAGVTAVSTGGTSPAVRTSSSGAVTSGVTATATSSSRQSVVTSSAPVVTSTSTPNLGPGASGASGVASSLPILALTALIAFVCLSSSL